MGEEGLTDDVKEERELFCISQEGTNFNYMLD